MNPGIFVGAGFLLGSVGLKALTSDKAKKVYVKGIVQGLHAKEEIETMVDEARAEFDDLMAEAGYIKDTEDIEEVLEGDVIVLEDTESTATEPNIASAAKKASETVKKVTRTATKSAAKGAGRGGHGYGRGGK